MNETLLSQLQQALPVDGVLTAVDDMMPYSTDWTQLPGRPSAVILPRTVAEVSSALSLCYQNQIAVVPSGGRTGLAAGAVPINGEVVLNLSRLSQIGEPSVLSRTVTVGAGAITQQVHQNVAEAGLLWPIDLASKGSCQVGGNLSTNAGGLRVIRYGMTRKWVTGLEVVKMDGTILHLNTDLEKNNTGYDLLQLVVGSEGTLCVITGATLKLTPVPDNKGKSVLLVGLESVEAISDFLEQCRRGPFEILAFEFFSQKCLSAVEAHLPRRCRFPKRHAFYALAEIAGSGPREDWLNETLALPGVQDAILADSTQEQQEIWGLREGITESLARTGPPRKHDLCVPLRSMSAFLNDVEKIPRQNLDLCLFGHFGDGSPHVNLVRPENVSQQVFDASCDSFEPKLFEVLRKYSGSISSEHGIGLLKKKWLHVSRSAEELELFRQVKKAWDPKGLLNPEKLIDL